MDLSIYVQKFEELVDLFGDGSDELVREDVNAEMRKRWPFYALAGADIQKIIAMMSNEDAWYYYPALKSYGAVIDIKRFIDAFDNEFIRKNRELFIERGVSPEELDGI